MSNARPIEAVGLPERLVFPLQQHIGEPSEPLVSAGDKVLKGQPLARAGAYVGAPIHASTSGTVLALEERPVAHPSGLSGPCVVLAPDGEDAWCERKPVADWESLNPSALRNLIRDAGIVGLGGAGFPTFIKLNPGPGKVIDTLILNGAECEPYITCDDRLMRERAREIVAGARIISHAVTARRCVVGIEDNKPEAIAAMREAAVDGIEVVQVPTRYPTGGERQLTQVLTGQEIPSDGLPMDIGVLVQNVASAVAIHRAVELGEPLVQRVVTVTGEGVAQPGNLDVLIGTPVRHLVEARGARFDDITSLIMGGTMMGFALHDDQVPVIKTSNCILAEVRPQSDSAPMAMPCIRCGACAEACPVTLLPQQLYWHARSKDFDKTQDYHLFDCIECGCCAYVCPSRIPLVSYYRYAKTEIWAQEREREKADLARQRHEARLARQERERLEREARHRKKKAPVSGGAGGGDVRKAAVEAALERAKAKHAQAEAPAPGMTPAAPDTPAGESPADATKA